jgi:hypothetical protein
LGAGKKVGTSIGLPKAIRMQTRAKMQMSKLQENEKKRFGESKRLRKMHLQQLWDYLSRLETTPIWKC